jgi:SagB-type dehydrogenase family enzyme
VVLAVDGIEPGIYHYSVRDNGIVSLRTGGVADLAVELCAGHEWLRTAAAAFFMTAVIERSAWKYPSSHAYRVLHLDAGHLGQTFHLVCTERGLGPFTFAATHNPAIEETWASTASPRSSGTRRRSASRLRKPSDQPALARPR